MTTYADFQQQPVASSSADFTLYGNDWNYDQSFMTQTSFDDQSYMNPTTFDPYAGQGYNDQYAFDAEQQYIATKTDAHNYSPASHSFDYQQAPVLSSTSDSGASVQSTISSAMASPSMHPQQSEWNQQLVPSIVHHDGTQVDFLASSSFDLDTIPVTDKGCVDPSLIQPYSPGQPAAMQYPDLQTAQSPHAMPYPTVPSPAPSKTSIRSPRMASGKMSSSPYAKTHAWHPYPAFPGSRRPSVSSVQSRHSQGSASSDDSNKGLCPIPTCGRHFKDLKAHMLTHQTERPEKCPIPTCEYSTKGFARKYDKNRHTLTHYKGTMVCGFCPGSGSAAEKSFNRADVFKRHLTSVHNVEQTPPNARRKSPAGQKRTGYVQDVSGMCSTCGVTFPNAQDFYEHLDDCVLRVVQQAEPSEAINEKLLSSVAEDADVQETMERHQLPTTVDYNASTSYDQEDDDEEDDDNEDDDTNDGTYGSRSSKTTKTTRAARKLGNSS